MLPERLRLRYTGGVQRVTPLTGRAGHWAVGLISRSLSPLPERLRELPNRILREGIVGSQRISKLSPGAQLFFYKLISIVDDYGRYEAYPEILRARCYPYELDSVTVEDVASWLDECGQLPANASQCPLLTAYSVKGKKYLQINDFGQRERSERFPPPSLADKSEQMTAYARASNTNTNTNSLQGISILPTTKQPSPQQRRRTGKDGPFKSPEQKAAFEEFWARYWRRTHRKDAEIAYCRAVTTTGAHRTVMEAVNTQMAVMMARDSENRPHAATWIHGARWNDVIDSGKGQVRSRGQPRKLTEEEKQTEVARFEELWAATPEAERPDGMSVEVFRESLEAQ